MQFLRSFFSGLATRLGVDPSGADSVQPETVKPKMKSAPKVSALPGIADPAGYWPASLAHLAQPYVEPDAEYVCVGEISEAPIGGYVGYRSVSVALVPLADLSQVLESTAATGHEVQSHGPLPIVDDGDPPHKSGFWVEGFERESRYESIVNHWRGSDTDVLVPDNNLLMVFGLVPRQIGRSEVCWDDPHGPIYDVVRACTISDHQLPKEQRQRAIVEIRRDYLLEYCRLKQAAAVAFFYEQRRSADDPIFDRVMSDRDSEDFHLPGRLLNLQVHAHELGGHGRQFAQVWARRLVISRGERRIIEVDDPDLTWPDHGGPMTMARAGQKHLMAYISDQVLLAYEGRSEFDILPSSGGVSYRGQWSVAYCQRIGRGHIAVELKKLYEGCPRAVIEHWHKHAVPQATAYADRDDNGDRSIATRAQTLIGAYLAMTAALVHLAERLGLSFDQTDIGHYSSPDVEYRGWWNIPGISSLANIVPPGVTLNEFLDRTVALVILWESVQQAPLRNMVLKLGIDRKKIGDFKSMKLLGTLCQLASIAKDSGHRWPEDSAHFVGSWDKEQRIPALRRLFSLNQLRLKAAHRTGADFAASLANELGAFGIDSAAQAAGWGKAVDSVYDGLIGDFNAVATLLRPSD